MSDSVEMLGNYGYYAESGSVISFQLGTNPTVGLKDPGFVNSNTIFPASFGSLLRISKMLSIVRRGSPFPLTLILPSQSPDASKSKTGTASKDAAAVSYFSLVRSVVTSGSDVANSIICLYEGSDTVGVPGAAS